jgi:hypothetical protein
VWRSIAEAPSGEGEENGFEAGAFARDMLEGEAVGGEPGEDAGGIGGEIAKANAERRAAGFRGFDAGLGAENVEGNTGCEAIGEIEGKQASGGHEAVKAGERVIGDDLAVVDDD